MSPVTIHLFANDAGTASPAPGQTTNRLQLTAVRAPNPATPGPNDTLFAKPNEGGIVLSMNGHADALHALFKGGRRYRLTIEEYPDAQANIIGGNQAIAAGTSGPYPTN